MFFFQLFLVDDVNATLDPDKLWVKAWFPIMFELSTIISRCKLDVRTRSVIREGGCNFRERSPGGFKGIFGGPRVPSVPQNKAVLICFCFMYSFSPED